MSNQLLAIQDFETTQKTAVALYKSGYFKDVVSESQAIVKILAGQELGLPPFASMSGIHIIQGKPVLGSNVIATLVKNSGRYDYNIKVCTNDECTIVWYENGKGRGESTFTMAEAKLAGLTGKDNWNKYPSDMLFARAISRGARRYAPGIFGGSPVYTPDELGVDEDEDGYITTTFVESPSPTNGNGHKPLVEAIIAEGGVPTASMSLETAENMVDSKKRRYGNMTNEELSGYSIGIGKLLAKNGLTPEQIDEYHMKQDAIKVILQSRAVTQN